MKKTNLTKSLFILLLINFSINAQILDVNDIRHFKIDTSTIIKKNGVIISEIPIDIIGSGGFKIRFSLKPGSANQTISQGIFAEIDFISDIKGPITSINPLSILDQQVFLTSDAVLEGFIDVNTLHIGDIVSVSGAISATDNSMQLSRIELENEISEWKLRGYARNITPTNFMIGNLIIQLNGVTAINCPTGFVNNTFVEIKATVDTNFMSGASLTTLTSIECQSADIDQGSVGVIPTVIEGIISNIIDLSSFQINDLIIFFDANTSFDNGESEHIDAGTKIEVQGFIDTNTGFVSATTIRFINHRVKLTAPVNPADIIINQSITVFGKTVHVTPQTRDDDNIISNGLSSQRQVEIRGFSDSLGNIFAQRVKDKGTADDNDTELRGDLTEINQPFLRINGILVDTTNSEFELNDELVSISVFFASLQTGMQIKIEEATFNSNTLTGGELELIEQETEDDPDDTDKNKSHSISREIIGSGGVGIATITGSEMIFVTGFE